MTRAIHQSESEPTMPKMKSHSGTKKRVKVTGSGKLMHRQANLGHLNAHKSSKRLRRLKGNTEMEDLWALRCPRFA